MDLAHSCMEWWWLHEEASDIVAEYLDEDGEMDISDDGMWEADCIAGEAWEKFEELSTAYKKENEQEEKKFEALGIDQRYGFV